MLERMAVMARKDHQVSRDLLDPLEKMADQDQLDQGVTLE